MGGYYERRGEDVKVRRCGGMGLEDENQGGPKMPRTQRLIINDETAVYHVMSRTALGG